MAKKTATTKKAATKRKTATRKKQSDKLGKTGQPDKVKITVPKQHKRRVDWEHNQVLVQDAFMKILKKKKRKPTTVELAEETGLSVNTIDSHVKEMLFEMQNDSWRTLTPQVIQAIYKGATRGGVFAQKLWLQVVEGWSEDININHGAQETLADVIANTVGIKLRKDLEQNGKKKR